MPNPEDKQVCTFASRVCCSFSVQLLARTLSACPAYHAS